jgi:hypothetical protein
MLGLADGIGRIGEMIRAPEKARARRRGLPRAVIGITHARRISGFVNDADNALPLHQFEVDLHQIVMRHVHHGVRPGEGRRWQREKKGENANDGKFHRADDQLEGEE